MKVKAMTPPIRYTVQEQREAAARKALARPRNPRQPNGRAGCHHCGGKFTESRHRAVCVKHGLSAPPLAASPEPA